MTDLIQHLFSTATEEEIKQAKAQAEMLINAKRNEYKNKLEIKTEITSNHPDVEVEIF